MMTSLWRAFLITTLMATPAVAARSVTLGGKEMLRVGQFFYDKAETTVEPEQVGKDLFYDADLARKGDALWMAWLEFVPEKGDVLRVGRRGDGQWAVDRRITDDAGRYAHPTLTVDADGRLWLTYEVRTDDGWAIRVRRLEAGKPVGPTHRLGTAPGNAINHSVAADTEGGLWVAWQADRDGRFHVMVRRVTAEGKHRRSTVSHSAAGGWHPSVAVADDGSVTVVWDAHHGGSFDVFARRRSGGEWGSIAAVAATPAFEARADAVTDPQGGTWVLWEEGAPRWGEDYTGKNASNRRNMRDANGPLHRLRKLRVAELTSGGKVRSLEKPLPLPTAEIAPNRKNKREGVKWLGMYYERGKLAVDGAGRLWVLYRHFYNRQLGCQEAVSHHNERGWRVYARCLSSDGWSKLYGFSKHQRDGMQRLSVAPSDDGVTAAWTIGRTDRRNNTDRGVMLASVTHTAGGPPSPALGEPRKVELPSASSPPSRPSRRQVGSEKYQLFYGDLHRHTDLSLCFPFVDGSIDSTYRYAIEVARLDFLAITDHTRDIDRGDALSQLWWRSTKEVTRHRLRETFFPYYAYERSRGTTDHNVISLRDDMLRPYQPPLTKFWKQIDQGDTITIPHAGIQKVTWKHKSDAKRPLLEFYQGFRDINQRSQAHYGLNRGHHVGFIASSDHLSTHASYACVWAPAKGREPIFRAMQARRTFGATKKVRLVFRSGDHWMGERFTTDEQPTFRVACKGKTSVQMVRIYRNGKKVDEIDVEGADLFQRKWTAQLEPGKEHYYYVEVVTEAGKAWSSPIWVTVE